MLEEALQEGFDRKGHGLVFAGVGGAVAEGDAGAGHIAVIVEGEQATIGDSDMEDIGGEILEDRMAVARGFAVHDPILPPDFEDIATRYQRTDIRF